VDILSIRLANFYFSI